MWGRSLAVLAHSVVTWLFMTVPSSALPDVQRGTDGHDAARRPPPRRDLLYDEVDLLLHPGG